MKIWNFRVEMRPRPGAPPPIVTIAVYVPFTLKTIIYLLGKGVVLSAMGGSAGQEWPINWMLAVSFSYAYLTDCIRNQVKNPSALSALRISLCAKHTNNPRDSPPIKSKSFHVVSIPFRLMKIHWPNYLTHSSPRKRGAAKTQRDVMIHHEGKS